MPPLKLIQNHSSSTPPCALSEGFITLFVLFRMFNGGVTGLSETDIGLSMAAVVTEGGEGGRGVI